jgi:hypothetical protein
MFCESFKYYISLPSVSGRWYHQIHYVFPWSTGVIFICCSTDHSNICIYGQYFMCFVCVCVCARARVRERERERN